MKLRTRVLALLMSVLMVLTSPMQALAEGEGRTKKQAEQSAALAAIQTLGGDDRG